MSAIERDAIRAELDRILASSSFDASARNRHFLRYVVEESLEGRADRIKAYAIAVSVFNRHADFDPQVDSIVRIEAGRLRRALERFYLMAGPANGVRISIPRGSYVPAFEHDAVLAAPAPGAPARRSGPAILLRPFDEEGDQSAYPNFTRGFARQILVGLTRYPALFVFGADTAFSGDVPAATLDPDYLLAGGTSLSGADFRADLLLTDARTGRCIWGDSFSQRLDPAEILRVRDEVTSAVVRHLAQPYGVLFSRRAQEVEGLPSSHLTGYDCVIRFYQYWRHFDRAMFDVLRHDLERATVREPSYADAFACLSMLYIDGFRYGYATRDELPDSLARSLALARKAVELAPLSSRCHHALGLVFWFQGDVANAVAALQKGIALNPNDTDIMAELGIRFAILAEWERGVPMIEASYARNPAQPSAYRIGLALWHIRHGRFEAALAEARRVDVPNVIFGHAVLAVAAAEVGLAEEASAALAALLRVDPEYLSRAAVDLAGRNVHPALVECLTRGLQKAAAFAAGPALLRAV
ncbi:MAG: hypothetical protein K5Q68_08815 [Roseococcus sp.]|nr:hypothetical protein [Roseococcus sp.]